MKVKVKVKVKVRVRANQAPEWVVTGGGWVGSVRFQPPPGERARADTEQVLTTTTYNYYLLLLLAAITYYLPEQTSSRFLMRMFIEFFRRTWMGWKGGWR